MNTSYFNENAMQFERQISLAFEKIWDYIPEDNNTNWTKAVNKILENVSRSFHSNVKIAASKLNSADWTEWLYDFVSYENSNIGLKDVILVAESEWKNPFGNYDYLQDIQDDFEKLILARSPFRLMIFEGNVIEDIQEYIVKLISVIEQCNLTKSGDRYMFLGWINDKEFYCDLYIH